MAGFGNRAVSQMLGPNYPSRIQPIQDRNHPLYGGGKPSDLNSINKGKPQTLGVTHSQNANAFSENSPLTFKEISSRRRLHLAVKRSNPSNIVFSAIILFIF